MYAYDMGGMATDAMAVGASSHARSLEDTEIQTCMEVHVHGLGSVIDDRSNRLIERYLLLSMMRSESLSIFQSCSMAPRRSVQYQSAYRMPQIMFLPCQQATPTKTIPIRGRHSASSAAINRRGMAGRYVKMLRQHGSVCLWS